MIIREVIKSITLLSIFQLVFSKRSANNLYSYFYPQNRHHHCHRNHNRHYYDHSSPPVSTETPRSPTTAIRSRFKKIDSIFGGTATSPAFTFLHSNKNSSNRGSSRRFCDGSVTKLNFRRHSHSHSSSSCPQYTKRHDWIIRSRSSIAASRSRGGSRTATSTSRNLFSFNLNDIINGKDSSSSGPSEGGGNMNIDNGPGSNSSNNDNDTATLGTATLMEGDDTKKDSNGFSSWTKRVINYQSRSYSSASINETTILSSKNNGKDNEIDDDDNEMKNSRASFSLSSLINVEALLLANGQVPLSNNTETEAKTGSSTAGIRLIKDMIRSNAKDNNINYTDDTDTASTIGNDANKAVNDVLISPSSTTVNITAIDINDAQEQLSLNALMQSIQQNLKSSLPSSSSSSPSSSSPSSEITTTTPSNGPRNFEFPIAAEYALKEATQSIEEFMNGAASTVSPDKVQMLITSASRSLAVDQNADVFKAVMDKVVMAAETLARDQGVDVSDAAAQARATTRYTADFLQVANGVLVCGYVRDRDSTVIAGSSTSSIDSSRNDQLAQQLRIPPSDEIGRPLFQDFDSVKRVPDDEFKSAIEKASDMALLSGAIYQDTIPRIHELGHSLVANGTAGDVVYMVSDSIGYRSQFSESSSRSSSVSGTAEVVNEPPILVRTITIRGFDASDESVDREQLLNQICDAAQVPFGDGGKNLNVHRGLLKVAKQVYKEIVTFIDTSGPSSKVVLNGHSIGGSISNLILLLLVEERGADFVNDKILRVFTFGSPPIATLTQKLQLNDDDDDDVYACPILKACSIRTDMVYGYAQPWDPIVRMFSPIDALYPLIGDLGDDGVSLYASGPPRTLRPITRAILESWSNWPTFRDDYRGVLNQEYISIGVQHLLMPDTGRYLTDRVVNVNIATFPIDDLLRVSSRDFYAALEMAFPLDTFAISLVPTAIRSFVHHFYPAYTDFADYSTKKKRSML